MASCSATARGSSSSWRAEANAPPASGVRWNCRTWQYEPTDAFVAKLNPNNAQTNAAQLLFSTYFGGNNDDSSTGLTIDTTASNVYITGSTQSTNFVFPTGAGVFQPCLNAPGVALASCPNTNVTNTDAYVAADF